ncbi:hypothetical protein GCM10010384_53260 [Streptomyces djakartensis]|uniref:Uncharacterized protein n=2 Tax=Streptomyces djakartensis TaxID=68193 RepID=A0ABQ3A7H0_9ACTN|nr:hypothetical protein GCM10010384_53260 [Streptomyces djakartensis]
MPVQAQIVGADRPSPARSGRATGRRAAQMKRMRIEKTRRAVRTRRHPDEPFALPDLLDPRDPEIVRAKRLALEEQGGGDGS